MIKSHRSGVSKNRAAGKFRRDIGKTHPKNLKMRGWMRGGIRL